MRNKLGRVARFVWVLIKRDDAALHKPTMSVYTDYR